MNEEREIWTKGRRGGISCITATITEQSILATAEEDKFTRRQMERALRREFPCHTFYFTSMRDCIRCDADRWTGDGIQ